MGKGGQEVVVASARKGSAAPGWKSPYDPRSSSKPKLPTKGELKAVIPAHCFERSYVKSFFYLVRDLAMAAACLFAANHCLSTTLSVSLTSISSFAEVNVVLLWVLGWACYAFAMGTVLTGVWVVAHECGHGAFSPSPLINDAVGFVCHQALLVPYFSWQWTHAKHHRRTNHLTDGESHVPQLRSSPLFLYLENKGGYYTGRVHTLVGDDAYAALHVLVRLCIGWPLYLFGIWSTGKVDQQGQKLGKYDYMDHFRPNSKMFPSNMQLKVSISTATIVATLAAISRAHVRYGHLPVILYYWGPYFVVNAWLVLYTWLQHTDPSIPHYDDENWTWMVGALSTIDRPYGVFDFFHHTIGSTHVAHHLFHEMPWYHADEATASLKAYLEPKGLYNYDSTPFYQAMWKIGHTCHFMESDKGIQYFQRLQSPDGSTARNF